MNARPDPHFRAVLRLENKEHLEHWEVQHRRAFLWSWYSWEPVRVVATRGQAQAEINRLEAEGVIYPEEIIHPDMAGYAPAKEPK